MSKMIAIAASNVRRMLRERSNICCVFIFSIALILLIGVQFGGDVAPGVGVFQQDRQHLGAHRRVGRERPHLVSWLVTGNTRAGGTAKLRHYGLSEFFRARNGKVVREDLVCRTAKC